MKRYSIIAALSVLAVAAQPARVGVGLTQRQLTLEDAIRMALENNLDIDIDRTTRDTAAQNVLAARGFFDPAFRWAPLYTSDNTPVASVLQGAGGKLTNKNFVSNFSFHQQLPEHGTTGYIDFNNLRTTTTNPFASFNPALTSSLVMGVQQPLIRGFRIDRSRAELKIRRKQVDQAGIDLETRVIDVVARTEQAYYDLVAARDAIKLAQDQVAWGREQLAINERFVRTGTLAPIEISAAEAELQRRIDTLYSTVAVLTESENNLKALIAPERTASIWGDELIPLDTALLQPPTDDLHEAVQTALERRTELRSIAVRSSINDIQKDLNSNLRKPQVDAIAQYSLNGLAGSVSSIANPFANLNGPIYDRLNQLSAAQGLKPLVPTDMGTLPSNLIGSYGSTLGNLFGGNYQSFQVGVSIDLNLRNRTADANYGQSLINEKRLRLEKARAEQTIENQVRNALQGIESSRQRITAAEASATAAKEKLESERRLYNTGESTNFLVLTRENEYADSRRRALLARLDFNKSIVRLEQALGTTLSSRKITVQ